jgi:hypothetical protein
VSRFDEERAPLDYECPECGAGPGKRCREVTGEFMEEKYGRPRRYRHVKPHRERVALAWRAWLSEPS